MSKSKKKLYTRKNQPWYQKKVALARGMEATLRSKTSPAAHLHTGDFALRAGDVTGAEGPHADVERRLARIKEGMKRWHKALRR